MAVLIRGARALRYAAGALAFAALLCASPAHAVGVGDRAPAFSLPDASGRTTGFDDARGQVAIVDFWASWCMPCAPLLPALDGLARRYEGRVRVYAIGIDKSPDKAAAFLREHLPNPSPFTTVLTDSSADVLGRYGASGMPSLFVVGPDGTVRLVEVGYSEDHVRAVDAAVRAAMPAAPRSN